MKPQRNNSCPCGSGLKYKKCCIQKETHTLDKVLFSIEELLSIARFGLENGDILAEGGKKTHVKDICISNGGDTVLVEFYAKYSRSPDVKTEIATIMSYLSGACKGELYQGIGTNFFAVKALDANEVEIMYAVCSKSTASTIAAGNPFDWLKSTIFQENTSDFRLTRAKTMIFDIENGLRDVICNIYSTKLGSNWWDIKIEPKLSSSIKHTYKNQFDAVCSDGKILINYAFTLDIKKIISADWGTFRHLFQSKTDFENSMVDLNIVRREEAHNRAISEQHVLDLERIYMSLLKQIAINNPNITLQFLLENWRFKIKNLMVLPPLCVYTMDEFNKQDLSVKCKLLIKDTSHQITYWGNTVAKLKSISPPLNKESLHLVLTSILEELLDIQKKKLSYIENYQFDDAIKIDLLLTTHLKKMDSFSKEFLLSES
ncbi:SEC-C domain-containing protein [Dyadobacter sp. CY345]|uniref:YecA family protein n=1 Tax=Dyadobacter sp. CY345 TaxID=2909335 RepID=UPI001F34D448|nr:SEC-C domain-containing protein [Dyadobacter sp. CY345]MCF2447620.1 SEC-C domain-containing protein [Dyadobacter sp. CY345]